MTRLLKPFLFYCLPILFYLALILGLSSMSSLPFRFCPGLHLDKLLHFAEYTILAFLVARAFGAMPRLERGWSIWILSSLVVLAVGCADECYQSIVPNRSSERLDLLADGLGGMVGSGLYLFFRFRFRG